MYGSGTPVEPFAACSGRLLASRYTQGSDAGSETLGRWPAKFGIHLKIGFRLNAFGFRGPVCALGLFWLLGLAPAAQGQEALRLSLAGAEAAEARRQAASTIGFYNLKLGPTGWRFGAGLGLQYSDNVNLGSANSGGDFSLSPQINAQMLWPVTDKNTLNLSVGMGYLAYLTHSELDRIFITPVSELSFDMYVPDYLVINLHDRFSVLQNSYQD